MEEVERTVFKAGYSKNATTWGVFFSIVFSVPLVLFLYLGIQGSSFFLAFMSAIFALVTGLMVYMTLSGRKMSYELGEDEFRVNFSLMKSTIPYTFIENVRIVDTMLLLRLFGGSWPGLHWGLFKAKGVGTVHVYSTKVKGDFVMISLVDGKKVAITPAEPEAFLTLMNDQRSKFGAASPKDIRLFEAFSRKVVYAQVLIVATAFAVFLGYFLWVYPLLPEIVPVHFNFSWIPDRWAHKSELAILPGLGALFPAINTVLALKYGKYGKGLLIFLGAIFVLITILFIAIMHMIQSFVL